MKQRLLVIASLTGLSIGWLSAVTSNFITPLSFEQKPRTYVHYPFWPKNEECSDWFVDAFGVYYQRNACCAFGQNPDCITTCNPCDQSNKVTSHTVPLAQLWFGKSAFTVANAFAGGVIPGGNPLLASTTFTPRFSYNERGAFLGLTVNRYNLGCCKDWFVSGRIGIPVKVVEVNQRQSVLDACSSINPVFADAIVHIQQQVPSNSEDSGPIDTKTVGAYRLDLLSALSLPDGTPMIEFGTTTGTAAGNTRIAGQDITNNGGQVSTQGPNNRQGPMYVYKQSSGQIPYAPTGLTYADVAASPPTGQNLMTDAEADLILPADGITGFPDGQWAVFGGISTAPVFNDQLDYAGSLGTSATAQRQLFIVPVWNASSPGWEEIGLVVENSISRAIEELEQDLPNPAFNYLCTKGIDIARSECSSGAGDLFIDIWGGKMSGCWFADGLIGFRAPTGNRLDDPRRVYAQPTGSNGHFAFKLGAEGGCMPCDWIGLKIEFFWNHFFKATEKRAAVFSNATVRNIGPCVDARVGWDTCILYLDATFFSKRCPDLGWDFGYEFYGKSKDRLCYCTNELADFAGVVRELDSCFARANTNTESHKLRAEIFNQWGCFQIFFGGSYIVAGKNVMKETEWHLGMKADF